MIQRPAPIKEKSGLIATTCGDCVNLNSWSDEFGGACAEVYGVKRSTRACTKFSFVPKPERYRNNSVIQPFINAALTQHTGSGDLLEEVGALAKDFVFAALVKNQSSNVHELCYRVATVLESQGCSAENLIPVFERLQRIRDRASMISAEARAKLGELDAIWTQGSAALLSEFREVRDMKPVDVRETFIIGVFAELDVRQRQYSSILSIADNIVKNCQASLASLIEIQSAFSGVDPKKRIQMLNSQASGSFIPRRNKKGK